MLKFAFLAYKVPAVGDGFLKFSISSKGSISESSGGDGCWGERGGELMGGFIQVKA